MNFDELSKILVKTAEKAEDLLALLSIMEIRGLIKQQAGRKFVRLC